jgi:hypothetical protein
MFWECQAAGPKGHVYFETLWGITEAWPCAKTLNRRLRLLLRGIDSDHLYVFIAVVGSMNVLKNKYFHALLPR